MATNTTKDEFDCRKNGAAELNRYGIDAVTFQEELDAVLNLYPDVDDLSAVDPKTTESVATPKSQTTWIDGLKKLSRFWHGAI